MKPEPKLTNHVTPPWTAHKPEAVRRAEELKAQTADIVVPQSLKNKYS